MRRLPLALLLLLPAGALHAQTSKLLDPIQILDPSLSARVVASTSPGDFCSFPAGDPRGAACAVFNGSGFAFVMSDASVVMAGLGASNVTTCAGPNQGASFPILWRKADQTVEIAMNIRTADCLACQGAICTEQESVTLTALPDVANGGLELIETLDVRTPGGGLFYHESGHVSISGFPRLFDTFLTFLPAGQIIVTLPAVPDGFRATDALQAWTGNVRSRPDWSQAQLLACSAAASPIPGQVVTIPDSLPDPAVGEGRYYITATRSGPDRRLGRRYVNGAFSARDPSSLPVCQ